MVTAAAVAMGLAGSDIELIAEDDLMRMLEPATSAV
jgi:hypothetical protein